MRTKTKGFVDIDRLLSGEELRRFQEQWRIMMASGEWKYPVIEEKS